jgi:hypothetical protein
MLRPEDCSNKQQWNVYFSQFIPNAGFEVPTAVVMGYNAVLSVECQLTFRRNISPPCSELATCFNSGFLFTLFRP